MSQRRVYRRAKLILIDQHSDEVAEDRQRIEKVDRSVAVYVPK